jgi:hypothetical protein
MGLKWLTRADDWPVVLRSEIEKNAPQTCEPDCSSLG